MISFNKIELFISTIWVGGILHNTNGAHESEASIWGTPNVRAPKHLEDDWGTDGCAPIDLFELRARISVPK